MSDDGSTSHDAVALAELALEAARAAAELVRERAADGVGVAATKTSDSDPVTEADRASEALIRSHIARRRPDDAFLGEEGDDVPGSSGVRWIIDPIDGTVNFLYGIPQYAVSIAAEVAGTAGLGPRVVAGVVLNVATGVEYVAHDRDGELASYRDGQRLAVRGPTPLARRLVATGFSYEAEMRAVQAAGLVDLLPRVRDIRRLGSCALDLCHVAEGAVDGYYEEGTHIWDHAAGALVARAAGARLALHPGAGGRPLLVCAPDHGFDELLEALVSAGLVRSGAGGGVE